MKNNKRLKTAKKYKLQLSSDYFEKGITLVALVVTIVVLIILAGVSISLVLGENGLIKNAKDARDKTLQTGKEESEHMKSSSTWIGETVNGTTGENGSQGSNPDNSENQETNTENGGSNTGSGSDTDIGDGDDDDDAEPEWKKLTEEERFEKTKKLDARLALFNYKVAGTIDDINHRHPKTENEKLIYDENGKYVYEMTGEKYKSVDEAKCECGKVREIYDKAKEMGLVKVYDKIEGYNGSVTATIKEPSVVLFDFACRNEEQKPGGVIPMAFAANYEINPNSKEWFDSYRPSFHKDQNKDGNGDYDNMLAWVDGDYVKNGFVIMQARMTMYPAVPILQLGQTVHMKIEVLSQKNFRKAMKALNLDLSEYQGKCSHPTV